MEIGTINITMDIFSVAILLVILIGCIAENNKIDNEGRPYFEGMLIALIARALVDIIIWSVDGKPQYIVLAVIVTTLYTLIGYISALMFMNYLHVNIFGKKTAKFIKIVHITFAIVAVIIVILSCTDKLFYYDNGCYTRGDWFLFTYFLPVILWISNIIIVVMYKQILVRERVSYLIYLIIPSFGEIFQLLHYQISSSISFGVIVLIVIYVNIYLQKSKHLVLQQKELTDNRVQMMISQIQPHFLYNTLTAIYGLCKENPEEAQNAIAEFSKYLRGNLDSLKKVRPVPFCDELEHIKIYVNLEKKRFQEYLNVEYDIECQYFMIPALSVQPIVENAIKHGICQDPEGGTLKLSTREYEKYFEISVEDDGIGFDINEKKEDGRSHVGLENVRSRLMSMVGATLEIESVVGQGTIARIRVPKK